ncbi:MAG: hypothetical protein KC776_12840, partial [Myxococcales bacterium]|nr:hypothetical protein [Myxococcales bacterium]
GSGGTAGAAGGGGMAGSSGAAGAAGAAGSSGNAAEAFCTKYETVCTFGGTDRYADKADCIAKYNSYDAARQACVETHLGNAEKGDPSLHCPHATGQSPCN